jgi:hypothetical protein
MIEFRVDGDADRYGIAACQGGFDPILQVGTAYIVIGRQLNASGAVRLSGRGQVRVVVVALAIIGPRIDTLLSQNAEVARERGTDVLTVHKLTVEVHRSETARTAGTARRIVTVVFRVPAPQIAGKDDDGATESKGAARGTAGFATKPRAWIPLPGTPFACSAATGGVSDPRLPTAEWN